jgi:hypothetical protein
MKRWLIINLSVLVYLLALSSVDVIAAYKGWVVDAETKEPVEGVVVFIEFVAPTLLGAGYYVDAAEARTDDKGYFAVPDKGWSFNLWQMVWTDTLVTIFKSGYEPIKGSSWGAMKSREWGAPKGTIVWKIEYGRPYILLKKANPDLKKRLSNFEGLNPGGPQEKRKQLDNEIQKEYEILLPCKKEKTC